MHNLCNTISKNLYTHVGLYNENISLDYKYLANSKSSPRLSLASRFINADRLTNLEARRVHRLKYQCNQSPGENYILLASFSLNFVIENLPDCIVMQCHRPPMPV